MLGEVMYVGQATIVTVQQAAYRLARVPVVENPRNRLNALAPREVSSTARQLVICRPGPIVGVRSVLWVTSGEHVHLMSQSGDCGGEVHRVDVRSGPAIPELVYVETTHWLLRQPELAKHHRKDVPDS